MAALTQQEVAAALSSLAGWKTAGDSITREYRFPDFMAAIRFVNRVAEAAQAADHHPDIDIRYNRVIVTLSTHDEGGVTKKDTDLAGQLDTAAAG